MVGKLKGESKAAHSARQNQYNADRKQQDEAKAAAKRKKDRDRMADWRARKKEKDLQKNKKQVTFPSTMALQITDTDTDIIDVDDPNVDFNDPEVYRKWQEMETDLYTAQMQQTREYDAEVSERTHRHRMEEKQSFYKRQDELANQKRSSTLKVLASMSAKKKAQKRQLLTVDEEAPGSGGDETLSPSIQRLFVNKPPHSPRYETPPRKSRSLTTVPRKTGASTTSRPTRVKKLAPLKEPAPVEEPAPSYATMAATTLSSWWGRDNSKTDQPDDSSDNDNDNDNDNDGDGLEEDEDSHSQDTGNPSVPQFLKENKPYDFNGRKVKCKHNKLEERFEIVTDDEHEHLAMNYFLEDQKPHRILHEVDGERWFYDEPQEIELFKVVLPVLWDLIKNKKKSPIRKLVEQIKEHSPIGVKTRSARKKMGGGRR